MSSVSGKPAIVQDLASLYKLLPHLPDFAFPIIHITGSNGKGSVSSFIDSALVCAGFKTGRFNSPPIQKVNDQIRISGDPVPYDLYKTVTAEIAGIDISPCRLTDFETLTAAALKIFHDQQVDIVILEVGMGGRRDATNFLSGSLTIAAVITTIELEHTAYLGNTLTDIATEKTGIFSKPGFHGIVVSSSNQHKEVWKVIENQAQLMNVSIYTSLAFVPCDASCLNDKASTTLSSQPIPQEYKFFDPHASTSQQESYCAAPLLAGEYQLGNAAMAMQTLRQISTLPLMSGKPEILPKHIVQGIKSARMPGRLDFRPLPNNQVGQILFDGAHNIPAIRKLRKHLDSNFNNHHKHFICAFSQPRDTQSILRELISSKDTVAFSEFTVPIEGYSWVTPIPASDLQAKAPSNAGISIYSGSHSISRALSDACRISSAHRDCLIVFTGSLYAVGEAITCFESDEWGHSKA